MGQIEPPICWQLKPTDFLPVRPLNWDAIMNDDDDDEHWVAPGVPIGGRSRRCDGNDNANSQGEEDMHGGEKHQQNVKSFGIHNWTMQQLWTATLILPDAARCSQLDWIQSDVFPGTRRLLHRCFSMLRKLWNKLQEYPEEFIVVFNMPPKSNY